MKAEALALPMGRDVLKDLGLEDGGRGVAGRTGVEDGVARWNAGVFLRLGGAVRGSGARAEATREGVR